MTNSICFCTLAIHSVYRRRARILCAEAPEVPWIVLTDEPQDFIDLPVRAIKHAPTGPMAADFVTRLPPTGEIQGAAAYHDRRFALLAALENHETAIYLDADSRITGHLPLAHFPSGLSVTPLIRESIAEHLVTCGSWRLEVFTDLARHLTGSPLVLQTAHWCQETPMAVTKDGRESGFFESWSEAANFLQSRDVYSGEGGVIGLAAACTGWNVDFASLVDFAALIQHEGGGPAKS